MCSPTLALTAVATGLQAFGQMQQANAQAEQLEQQAQLTRINAQNNREIAEFNAKVLEQNAELKAKAATDVLNRGAQDAGRIKESVRRANATARAIQGSSGLLTDTGTNLDILVGNAGEGELAVLTTLNNAEREAFGIKINQNNDLNQAQNLRFQGDLGLETASFAANSLESSAASTRTAGFLSAGATAVTGAVDFGNMGGFGTQQEQAELYSFSPQGTIRPGRKPLR